MFIKTVETRNILTSTEKMFINTLSYNTSFSNMNVHHLIEFYQLFIVFLLTLFLNGVDLLYTQTYLTISFYYSKTLE